jgi:hypothetical protein|tara:strand:+ start:2437 stop:2697 length:261 start_codon:yes stop_codon:yes gene_type:complete
MPYIKPEHRKEVEDALEGVGLNFVPKDAGQLNYVITVLIDNYIRAYGKNYANLNTIIGALECCKQEYYRTIVGPYEDMKIDENGDV